MLITPFNQAVFQFASHRAQTFAAQHGYQLFWMQAVDHPPAWYGDTMTKKELEEAKGRWLRYHARKTEGILSLCPCCYDMPLRVTHGNGYLCKEYGIHNGATGILKAVHFGDEDCDALKGCADQQVVLASLPQRLILQMDQPMKKQFPGLDTNCFPLSPVTVYWTLDKDGDIAIARKGFPSRKCTLGPKPVWEALPKGRVRLDFQAPTTSASAQE